MTKTYSQGEVAEAIKITAEVCGSELSDGAIKAMMLHLKPYGAQAVMQALTQCQREVKGKLGLSDILQRLADKDGRPGAEEAWALVANALNDESETIVWTEEMAHASIPAAELMQIGDKIGARMAFRETYDRLVSQARIGKAPVRWSPSPGSDPVRRTAALMQAVEQGKLPSAQVVNMLPYQATAERHKLLTGEPMSLDDKRRAKEALTKISGMLTVKTIGGDE